MRLSESLRNVIGSASIAIGALTSTTAGAAMDDKLITPLAVIADGSLSGAERDSMSLAARRYYTFWNTGDESYAKAALASNFVDRNLPPGRPQGPEGPLFASRFFRAAVPDLRMDVEEMILVGDRVIGRLHFTGHFSGRFGSGTDARQGDGRTIDFIAVDIYRIANGRIADNWHLEDNLTFLKQIGAVN